MDARHVYVHVPFCARRCSYCDFAIAVRRSVPVADFIDAVTRELGLRSREAAGPVETLYLGGGTPSRLGGDGVHRLLETLRATLSVASDAEVTIEANPEDVTVESALQWRRCGVTRVSLGVQSLNDQVLRWMHRTHDAAQAERAADILRMTGFEDWSLDLIFALPPEVERSWREDLERAISLGPTHLSCYGLTVEPHTPLMKWRERGQVRDADEDRYASEFLDADRVLAEAGYEHYEVSNYARPQRRSRHNSAYWRRVSYLGLGPSAHSFDGLVRSWNTREYAAWQQRVISGQDPTEGREELDTAAVCLERAYLALRTDTGLRLGDREVVEFDRWRDRGWATVVDGIGRLTPAGWLRLDAIVARLTDLRSH